MPNESTDLVRVLRDIADRFGKDAAVAFALDRIVMADVGDKGPAGRKAAVAMATAAFTLLRWRPLTDKAIAHAVESGRQRTIERLAALSEKK